MSLALRYDEEEEKGEGYGDAMILTLADQRIVFSSGPVKTIVGYSIGSISLSDDRRPSSIKYLIHSDVVVHSNTSMTSGGKETTNESKGDGSHLQIGTNTAAAVPPVLNIALMMSTVQAAYPALPPSQLPVHIKEETTPVSYTHLTLPTKRIV